jgi:hypothetical protein
MVFAAFESAVSRLAQREFVSTLGALGHIAMHGRIAARTGKSSAVGNVERKAALRASHHLLGSQAHLRSLYKCEPIGGNLKTFLKTFKRVDAQVLTLQVNKWCNSEMCEKSKRK